MSMNVGKAGGGPSADINMTPMIDILLVLLIIFMVVQQGLQKGLSVQIPPLETPASNETVDQIVLEVLPGGQYLLNQQPLNGGQLSARLHEVYDERSRKVLFVKGAEDASYGAVTDAVDIARQVGVEIVGWVPRPAAAAPPAP